MLSAGEASPPGAPTGRRLPSRLTMGNIAMTSFQAASSGCRFGGDKLPASAGRWHAMGVAAARSHVPPLEPRRRCQIRPGRRQTPTRWQSGVRGDRRPRRSSRHGVTVWPPGCGQRRRWRMDDRPGGRLPCIKPETHRLISQALQAGGSIVAPGLQRCAGHPGGVWGQVVGLSTLRGDTGAKESSECRQVSGKSR